MREIIKQFGNGFKERISIENFGKLIRGVNPVKLSDEDFAVLENLVRQVNNYGTYSKRYGLQRYNSNAISAQDLINLYEAKLNGNYYLLCKDGHTSASSSTLAYIAGLSNYGSGTWTNVSTTEYASHYRFVQFADKVYIVNRVNDSSVLQDNKMWQGTPDLFAHGCLPEQTDEVTLADGVVVGAMETAKNYVYIIVNVYDDYQVSASFEVRNFYNLNGAEIAGTSVKLTLPAVTNTRITARKIYRSKALDADSAQASSDFTWNAPPEDYYYIATIQGTSSATYIDTKDDATLGLPLDITTFFDQKRPYKAKHATVAKSRLILANLQDSSLAFSAITGSNISLTAGTSGSLTSSKRYYFRFYKAYATHSGGRNVYTVGDVVQKDILLGAGEDSITIDLTSTADFDDWCNYVLIERTVGDGSEYYPIGIMHKSDTFTTIQSDIELTTNFGNILLDIVKTEGDGLLKRDKTSSKSYFDLIAISEINSGDLIPAENLISLNIDDNRGVTGIYNEQGRLVIFSSSAIYTIDTDSQTPEFWIINKVVSNIGAMGQDLLSTETVGHNGIVQLPDNSGYIFFSRATSASSQDLIRVYYWNGNSNSQPIIISDDIHNLINGNASFRIYGMCYDHINNWVWTTIKIGSNYYAYIYSLDDKEWYVFVMTYSTMKLLPVICVESGRIFVGTASGYFQYYGFDIEEGTRYYDRFYLSGALNYHTYTAKLQTKTFDYLDADLILAKFGVVLDLTGSNSTTSGNMVICLNNSTEDVVAVATASGATHKIQRAVNMKGNKFYVRWENAEAKGMVLQKLYIDVKQKHKFSAGR